MVGAARVAFALLLAPCGAQIGHPAQAAGTAALYSSPLRATPRATPRIAVGRPLGESLPRARPEDYAGLRIFIYDLPDAYHADLQEVFESRAREAGSNCDYMLSPCTEERWAGGWSVSRQRGMEVIILRKLLASPALTTDPREADLFVVPYLVATDCWLGGLSIGCHARHSPEPENIFSMLPHYNPSTRHRHLFLASADQHNLPLQIQAQSLIVSKGASWGNRVGHFVVPTAVTDEELQPNHFNDTGLDGRDLLFWLVQTPNSAVRFEIQRQLLLFDAAVPEHLRPGHLGARLVRVEGTGRDPGAPRTAPAPREMGRQMRRAILCPAPPTETSGGMKRLMDAVLSGCVPVVPRFVTVWGSGVSWWRRDGTPVEWSLPFSWEVDWRRLAVEVPADLLYATESVGPGGRLTTQAVPFVQACLAISREELEAKRRYLLEVRNLLLYDLTGGTRDAFSVLMDGIRSALERLLPVMPSVGLRVPLQAALVCDVVPRKWLHVKLPEELVGADAGIDKGWSHTFGSVSCVAIHLWRTPSDLWAPGALVNHSAATLTAERFYPGRMARSPSGAALFVQEAFTVDLLRAGQSHVLGMTGFAACRASPAAAVACHDEFMTLTGHGLAIRSCQDIPINWRPPPNVTCRLLPELPPYLAPATLDIRPGERWDVLVHACNITQHLDALAAELLPEENSSATSGRSGRTFQGTAYEACGAQTDDATDTGTSQTPGQVLLDHLLAIMQQQRSGTGGTPDVVVILNDRWIQDIFTHGQASSRWPKPKEVVERSLQRVAALPDEVVEAGRWLLAFDGPPGTWNSCGEFLIHIAEECTLPAEWARPTPLAVAFPTRLLEQAPETVWQSVAMTLHRVDGHTSVVMGALFVLLAREVVRAQAQSEGRADVYFETYESLSSLAPEAAAAARCLGAFDEGHWPNLSGAFGRAVNEEILQQADECRSHNGEYVLWNTQLNESTHDPSWPIAPARTFRTWLGSLPLEGDEWLPFEHFGICVPKDCTERDWAAVGWRHLTHHKFGLSAPHRDSLSLAADLPAPKDIQVQRLLPQIAKQLELH